MNVIRAIVIVAVILGLCGVVAWSWWIIAVPLLLLGTIVVIGAILLGVGCVVVAAGMNRVGHL